jgi:hypothetical protein
VSVKFLDIDGVLNSLTFFSANPPLPQGHPDVVAYLLSHIDRDAIANLNVISEGSGAEIVISSAWRIGIHIDLLRHLLRAAGATANVVGITPSISFADCKDGVPRGCEIRNYMRVNHGHEDGVQYVILDDDVDNLAAQASRFVLTTKTHGLTRYLAEVALQILQK